MWLPWCHENYSIEESREFVSSRAQAALGDEWHSFATFEKDSARFLGGVGLNFFNRVHQMANLGYWVRTSATGSGVATQAARLVARFGFAQLGLHRIEILAGALREGVLRKRLLIRGQSQDAVLFSLLPEDVGLPAGL